MYYLRIIFSSIKDLTFAEGAWTLTTIIIYWLDRGKENQTFRSSILLTTNFLKRLISEELTCNSCICSYNMEYHRVTYFDHINCWVRAFFAPHRRNRECDDSSYDGTTPNPQGRPNPCLQVQRLQAKGNTLYEALRNAFLGQQPHRRLWISRANVQDLR